MLSLDQFSDIVDHIYDGAVDRAQWPHILGRLMHASGAAAGALLASDSQQRQLNAVHVGFDHAAQISYNQYYCDIDPVAPVLERSPLGSVLLSHSIVARRGRRTRRSSIAIGCARRELASRRSQRSSEMTVSSACCASADHLRARKKFDAGEISNFLMHVIPHLRKALQVSLVTQSQEIERGGMVAASTSDTPRRDYFGRKAEYPPGQRRSNQHHDAGRRSGDHARASMRNASCQNSALQRLIGLAINRDRVRHSQRRYDCSHTGATPHTVNCSRYAAEGSRCACKLPTMCSRLHRRSDARSGTVVGALASAVRLYYGRNGGGTSDHFEVTSCNVLQMNWASRFPPCGFTCSECLKKHILIARRNSFISCSKFRTYLKRCVKTAGPYTIRFEPVDMLQGVESVRSGRSLAPNETDASGFLTLVRSVYLGRRGYRQRHGSPSR